MSGEIYSFRNHTDLFDLALIEKKEGESTYKSGFHVCKDEDFQNTIGEEVKVDIEWKLANSCFFAGICMCADSKEDLTIYETNKQNALDIGIVPCGRFDTKKTSCAPSEVISEFL